MRGKGFQVYIVPHTGRERFFKDRPCGFYGQPTDISIASTMPAIMCYRLALQCTDQPPSRFDAPLTHVDREQEQSNDMFIDTEAAVPIGECPRKSRVGHRKV
jgi:hypothetical protein